MSKAALIAAIVALAIAPTIQAAEPQHVLPESPRVLVREQPPASGDRSHPVLYIHGSSFPCR